MSQLKVENIKTSGWETAIRGMRNPMNSWNRSDSHYDDAGNYFIGWNDMQLMKQLAQAGDEHGKYLRMIRVSFDITMPLYFAKQIDTYKVGVNCNSCSTMHKVMAKEFTSDDFADNDSYLGTYILKDIIEWLNVLRNWYLNYDKKDDEDFTTAFNDALPYELAGEFEFDEMFKSKKEIWNEVIKLLPESYMQKRTYEMSYQALINIIRQRRYHKLSEWRFFCSYMLEKCPYLRDIMEDMDRN